MILLAFTLSLAAAVALIAGLSRLVSAEARSAPVDRVASGLI